MLIGDLFLIPGFWVWETGPGQFQLDLETWLYYSDLLIIHPRWIFLAGAHLYSQQDMSCWLFLYLFAHSIPGFLLMTLYYFMLSPPVLSLFHDSSSFCQCWLRTTVNVILKILSPCYQHILHYFDIEDSYWSCYRIKSAGIFQFYVARKYFKTFMRKMN